MGKTYHVQYTRRRRMPRKTLVRSSSARSMRRRSAAGLTFTTSDRALGAEKQGPVSSAVMPPGLIPGG